MLGIHLCPVRFALQSFLPFLFVGVCLAASAPTTTVLGLSSSSVPQGTPVTLTAVVLANNLPVSPGLITFQDGKTVIGSAQLLPSGTASIKVRLGLGTHQLSATFAGTKAYAKSVSPADPFTVTGTVPTTTGLIASGTPGNYTLMGTVTGSGPLAPTGTVSFLDQTNSNTLGGAALGASTISQTFQPQQTFGTGGNPFSVAVGDLNGDGIPDLAVVNFNTVSVLLGKGDGTFQTQQSYAAGSNANYVAVGDFNGDGIPDLAVANYDDNTVSVLLGIGNGAFQTQQTYPVGSHPESLAVGDLNADGIPDVAVTNFYDNTVSVLLGTGNGAFQNQYTLATGEQPYFVLVADFNSDGVPDLAVANASANTVSVLLGIGNGAFQTQQTYAVGLRPGPLAVGDFNADGIPDVAVANKGDSTVSVLLGTGNGAFQAQQTYVVGTSPSSVAVGDFNRDGLADLGVSNSDAETVSVLLGKGDGTFQTRQTYGTGIGPVSVAVADFNGDGLPDLAVANFNDGNVGVLLNSFTQSASATLNNTPVIGTGTHQVAANYGGDSYHQPSASSSIPLVASQITTSLSLSANQSTITAGQPVTFTASLNVYAYGSLNATGETITFYNGAVVLGTGTLNSQGQASLTTSALPVGPDTITAKYPGDPNFTASTSNSQTVTVNAGPDFTITPLPPQETIYRGHIAGFILELQSVNGFNANVTLSCSGGPSGSYCVDFPKSVHVNGKAYAFSGICFPKNTKDGTYTVTFTAVSGSLTHTATAKFTVK